MEQSSSHKKTTHPIVGSNNSLLHTLGAILRDFEILSAVKSFNPLKALGLNGLYPFFY